MPPDERPIEHGRTHIRNIERIIGRPPRPVNRRPELASLGSRYPRKFEHPAASFFIQCECIAEMPGGR